MSLLTMLQRVANETGLSEPDSVVTSLSRDVKHLLAITYRVGHDLRVKPWPALNREETVTLVGSQEAYALPDDFDYELFNTHWDTNTNWPLNGPYTPQEWQDIKNNTIASSAFRRKYRVKGIRTNTFYLDPVPSSDEAGDELVYEYQSLNWFRPRTWTTSTAYSAGDYVFYDGYYFQAAGAGVSGATAPTPTGLNDGGVTWEVVETYPTFTADTDIFLIDEDLVGLGVQWNYLASKGLPYQHLESKYNRMLDFAVAKARGARIISLNPCAGSGKSIYPNIPETIDA